MLGVYNLLVSKYRPWSIASVRVAFPYANSFNKTLAIVILQTN